MTYNNNETLCPICRYVKETWINKQSHFEPKPTLRASSAFVARPPSQYSKGYFPWSEVTLPSPHFLCLHIS